MTELELFDRLNPRRDLPQATCDIISQVYKIMQKDNAEKDERIAELEAYNEKLLNGDIEKHNKIVELVLQVEKLERENAEAMEIIREYLDYGNMCNVSSERYWNLRHKAEQFCKEIKEDD